MPRLWPQKNISRSAWPRPLAHLHAGPCSQPPAEVRARSRSYQPAVAASRPRPPHQVGRPQAPPRLLLSDSCALSGRGMGRAAAVHRPRRALASRPDSCGPTNPESPSEWTGRVCRGTLTSAPPRASRGRGDSGMSRAAGGVSPYPLAISVPVSSFVHASGVSADVLR